jgi:hypothetical protein
MASACLDFTGFLIKTAEGSDCAAYLSTVLAAVALGAFEKAGTQKQMKRNLVAPKKRRCSPSCRVTFVFPGENPGWRGKTPTLRAGGCPQDAGEARRYI